MQVSFDDVIKQERHGRARDARHHNLEPKGKRVLFPKRFFAVLKLEREHFVPEQDDHRKDCAELNHNKEHFLERIVCVELQELIHKQHVPGAADRQPLGNPFHNPEENHFQKLDKIRHAAVCLLFQIGAPPNGAISFLFYALLPIVASEDSVNHCKSARHQQLNIHL